MILVTGAAGFIGSNLCELLLEKGYEVIGIDNFYNNYERWIKEYHLKYCLGNPNFIFLEYNILEPNIMKLIEGLKIDCIIHLADIPGVAACNEINFDEYIKYNIVATQRMLDAIKNKGVKKLIYASSSTVYGENEGFPMSELHNPRPISLYGVTKLAGETLCHYYGKVYDISVSILRFFTVYGPRQRPDMAFHNFIKKIINGEEIYIYGDGEQRRDFIYVEDICEIILNLLELDLKNEILNVGGGITLSVNESIEIIEKLLNKKAVVKYIDPIIEEQVITYASVEKLQDIITLNKKTDIYEGLKKEIGYIKSLYNLKK
ncbi:NAD-dependent epimerase/dehydratase family protein [Caloranaerobacter azorensis]|uniref:NAD-dependent epimerase/dehydratase family protein n=1 Tax=Caloranaerobacter azorensis TaxID=116090 RepID=A0A6P1YEZ1_9FIRM|nr:NAD-dependent epimerase/dehydratase family protein [Caloranaerobacter azorensis]QIB26506.1 NAD-dependent epimerase/dehydratase family protein [Caloranaerobacter azorensis]